MIKSDKTYKSEFLQKPHSYVRSFSCFCYDCVSILTCFNQQFLIYNFFNNIDPRKRPPIVTQVSNSKYNNSQTKSNKISTCAHSILLHFTEKFLLLGSSKFLQGGRKTKKLGQKKSKNSKQKFFLTQRSKTNTCFTSVFFSFTFLKGTIWFSRMAVKVASVRI